MKATTDCYEYVRNYYHVPAYIGTRVQATQQSAERGVIVAAKSNLHYIHVRFEGAKFSVPVHPLDVYYLGLDGEQQ